MTNLRKRFKKCSRMFLVIGFVLSILSIVYGLWSIQVFRSGYATVSELKEAPFYHPWTVWVKVARVYVKKTGNWDPAASGEFISTCMLTMIYAGVGLLLICSIAFVIQLVRNNGTRTQNRAGEHSGSGGSE